MSFDQIGHNTEDIQPKVEGPVATPKEYGQTPPTVETRDELPNVEAGFEDEASEPNSGEQLPQEEPIPMTVSADGKHYPQRGTNPLFQKEGQVTANTIANTKASTLQEEGIEDHYGFYMAAVLDA